GVWDCRCCRCFRPRRSRADIATAECPTTATSSLQSQLASAGECAVEVNGLQSGGPVSKGFAVGLRGLLAGAQNQPFAVERVKLDPACPSPICPGLTVGPRDVHPAIGVLHLRGVLED